MFSTRSVQLLIRFKRKIPTEKMKKSISNVKMFNTEDFIIAVFCCVDDLWHQVTQGQKIRKGGFAPSLSDNEMIAMELVGEFLAIETDIGGLLIGDKGYLT